VVLIKELPIISMDEERIKERQDSEDKRRGLLKEMVKTEAGRQSITRFRTVDQRKLGEFESTYKLASDGPAKSKSHSQVLKELRSMLEDGDLISALCIWIMTTEVVSELLPSKLGLFDLVILEEASQSDCLAIPALLRGKKLVVIGDTQQVNPPDSRDDFKQFVEKNLGTHLPSDTIKNLLPGKSIFHLFENIFQGPTTTILLREHFRYCSYVIQILQMSKVYAHCECCVSSRIIRDLRPRSDPG